MTHKNTTMLIHSISNKAIANKSQYRVPITKAITGFSTATKTRTTKKITKQQDGPHGTFWVNRKRKMMMWLMKNSLTCLNRSTLTNQLRKVSHALLT